MRRYYARETMRRIVDFIKTEIFRKTKISDPLYEHVHFG